MVSVQVRYLILTIKLKLIEQAYMVWKMQKRLRVMKYEERLEAVPIIALIY